MHDPEEPFAGCGYHSTVQGTTVLLVYELRLTSGISLLTKPLRKLLLLQYHCVVYYSAELVHDMYIRVLSMVGPVPPAIRDRAWEGCDVQPTTTVRASRPTIISPPIIGGEVFGYR
jgi:hypothetical protein